MAQNQFINIKAGIKLTGNGFSHDVSHASATASDMTISWDSAKFTTKTALKDALRKVEAFFDSRGDLAA